MKRIEVLCTFKDGSDVFHAGETRFVPEGKAGYFCGLGWARDIDGLVATGEAKPADVKLDIQSGKAGHAVTKLGDK